MQQRSTELRERILDAGLEAWPNITLRDMGRRVGMTHSAILYHYKSSDALRAAIASHAIATRHSGVVVQLIAANDPAVMQMTAEQRAGYLSAL